MTITYKEREYPLAFMQGSIMWMQEKLDMESISQTAGYATVWGALKMGAYLEGKELTKAVTKDGKLVEELLTFIEVCYLVEELPKEKMVEINAAFQESTAYKRNVQENNEQKKTLVDQSIEPNVTEPVAVN